MASDGDGRVMISEAFFKDEIKNKDGTTTIKCKEHYSRREIQNFLEKESKADPVLKPIVEMMKGLNPPKQGNASLWKEGTEYSIMDPGQIIYREKSTVDSGTKIPTVRKDKRFTTQPRNPDEHKPYWNLWSLLGLFLSLKYKAHPLCTTIDFFARLTTMYAWWCRTLVPNEKEYPAVCQCTWGRAEANDAFDLFLGHSFGGAKAPVEPGKKVDKNHPWLLTVKRARYELLEATVTSGGKKWDFDTSPQRKVKKESGTRFGNCGETYPFLSLVVRQPNIPAQYVTYGCALNWEYFKYKKDEPKPDNPKDYNPKKAQESYMPPCANCKELLRLCGVQGQEMKRYTPEFNWNDGKIRDSAGKPIVIN